MVQKSFPRCQHVSHIANIGSYLLSGYEIAVINFCFCPLSYSFRLPHKAGKIQGFLEVTTQFYSLSGPQLKALGQLLTKRMQFLLLIAGSSITSLSIYLTVVIRL